jgi:copper resistance protein C
VISLLALRPGSGRSDPAGPGGVRTAVLGCERLLPVFRQAIVLAPVLLVLGLFLLGAPAGAHAFLRRADPPAGSVLPTSPHRLLLEFTETVEPAFSAISVTDASGHRMAAGKAQPEGGARLAVSLPPLPPGRYRVHWQVTATDTHRTQGSFIFTIGRPG